jgi:hypothetical protein
MPLLCHIIASYHQRLHIWLITSIFPAGITTASPRYQVDEAQRPFQPSAGLTFSLSRPNRSYQQRRRNTPAHTMSDRPSRRKVCADRHTADCRPQWAYWGLRKHSKARFCSRTISVFGRVPRLHQASDHKGGEGKGGEKQNTGRGPGRRVCAVTVRW